MKGLNIFRGSIWRKFCFLLVFFVISYSFYSCVSVSRSTFKTENVIPEKFLNPYQKYDKRLYLASVGTGETLSQAQQSALSSLSQQITVSVKAMQDTQETFTQKIEGDKDSLLGNVQLKEKTSILSSNTLIGVEYGESFKDKTEKVYAIAYINRISGGNIYRTLIDENRKKIAQFFSTSKKQRKLKRYASIFNALQLSKQNDEYIAFLTVLSPSIATITRKTIKITSMQLEQELSNVGNDIQFYIAVSVSGNKRGIRKSGKIEEMIRGALAEALTEMKFSVVNASHIKEADYIADVSLSLKNSVIGDYATVEWKVLFYLTNNNNVLMAQSKKGISKGKDIVSAYRFADADIEKKLRTFILLYIKKQIARENR